MFHFNEQQSIHTQVNILFNDQFLFSKKLNIYLKLCLNISDKQTHRKFEFYPSEIQTCKYFLVKKYVCANSHWCFHGTKTSDPNKIFMVRGYFGGYALDVSIKSVALNGTEEFKNKGLAHKWCIYMFYVYQYLVL